MRAFIYLFLLAFLASACGTASDSSPAPVDGPASESGEWWQGEDSSSTATPSTSVPEESDGDKPESEGLSQDEDKGEVDPCPDDFDSSLSCEGDFFTTVCQDASTMEWWWCEEGIWVQEDSAKGDEAMEVHYQGTLDVASGLGSFTLSLEACGFAGDLSGGIALDTCDTCVAAYQMTLTSVAVISGTGCDELVVALEGITAMYGQSSSPVSEDEGTTYYGLQEYDGELGTWIVSEGGRSWWTDTETFNFSVDQS